MAEECYKEINPSFNTDPDGKHQKIIDDIMNKIALESYNEWLKEKK